MSNDLNLEPVTPGRRRRFTPEQKRALLDEVSRSGQSITEVARAYGLAPNLLFKWKRVMDDATKKGLKRNEKVVPESEVKALKDRIRDLERALGRKTMENEILQEAVKIFEESAEEKKRKLRESSSGKGGGR